jgi:hypothetical protein
MLLPVPSSGFRVQHGVGAVQHSVWVLLPLPFSGFSGQHGVGAVACALFRCQGRVAAVACALVGGVLLPLLVL